MDPKCMLIIFLSLSSALPLLVSDFRNLYYGFGAAFIVVSAFMLVTLIVSFCLMSGIAKVRTSTTCGECEREQTMQCQMLTLSLALARCFPQSQEAAAGGKKKGGRK